MSVWCNSWSVVLIYGRWRSVKIKEYYRPENLEEAYSILGSKDAVIIGGGAFLNLREKEIGAALDLSALKLDYIEESQEEIRIGSMTSLREVETSEILNRIFGSVLRRTVESISGVQLRNTATIGGSVAGKYGFSDILTTLLALEACVELYKGGIMSLEDFMEAKLEKDLIISIIIKKEAVKAAYSSFRNTSSDFPVLNTAVSKKDNVLRICVGARPGGAAAVYGAMEYINKVEINEETAARAGEIAAESLRFGTDSRASFEYRKELCKVMVKRCIMEVSE
jgi:CO/xanthine dehydrogenase FAD-binding subunit